MQNFEFQKQSLKIIKNNSKNIFSFSEESKIKKLIKKNFSNEISFKQLIEYIRKSIYYREYSKFIFTKNVDLIFQILNQIGKLKKIKKDDLIYLRYDEIASIKKNLNKKILSRKKEFQTNIKTKLPEVILDSSASDIIPYMFNVPNFITNYRVRKSIKYINASNIKQDLKNKIVLIENADPGFDWLFSKKIKGLITQYGGANSHMAIRCAELNIPAAIGCGEKKFDEIKKAKFVELDCALNTIKQTN